MTETTVQPGDRPRVFLSVYEPRHSEAEGWALTYPTYRVGYGISMPHDVLRSRLAIEDIDLENPRFFVGRPGSDMPEGWYSDVDDRGMERLPRFISSLYRWNNSLLVPDGIRAARDGLLMVEVVLGAKGKPDHMRLVEPRSHEIRAPVALTIRRDGTG